MDTSKEYILLCEKATEIQKGWEPKMGDYLLRTHTIFGKEIDKQIWNNTSEINIIHYKSSEAGGWFSACNEEGEQRLWKNNHDMEKEISIWLPRQDQLQEILNKGLYGNINKAEINLAFFSSEVQPRNNKEQYQSYQRFTTFEQLWLAFVMKIAYSKVWNSEKEEWELID